MSTDAREGLLSPETLADCLNYLEGDDTGCLSSVRGHIQALAFMVQNAETRAALAEADNAALKAMLDKTGRHISGCSTKATKYQCIPECGLEATLLGTHPGAALADLAHAVRQYQHRDETTLTETFRRLMGERARIAQMHAPEYAQALEAVREAAEPFRDRLAQVAGRRALLDEEQRLLDACAAVDALKEKP